MCTAILHSAMCLSVDTYILDKRQISSSRTFNDTFDQCKHHSPHMKFNLIIQLLIVAEVFYVLTMMALKAALALFFLRIIVEPWQRRVVYFNLIATTVFGIGYFFFAVFQCGVLNGTTFWIRKLTGKCSSTALILGLGYTHALINALTDLTFVALSIPMLNKVRINYREKIIVGGIFSLASVYVIIESPWSRVSMLISHLGDP